jgi:hypothetical protein
MPDAARRLLQGLALAATCWLAGCDLLGIDTPAKVAERRGAESQAIGAACRHAGRAIEDCFVLHRKADKAAVFAGWREMDDYMRANQIDAVAPQLTAPTQAGAGELTSPAPDAADARPRHPPS